MEDSIYCYELGIVKNDIIEKGSKFGHCPGGPITSGSWFNITVKVGAIFRFIFKCY